MQPNFYEANKADGRADVTDVYSGFALQIVLKMVVRIDLKINKSFKSWFRRISVKNIFDMCLCVN